MTARGSWSTEKLIEQLMAWANINTFSHNKKGLETCLENMAACFDTLSDHTYVDHGLGIARFTKNETASKSILLNCHCDTVFSEDSGFLSCTRQGNKLQGPGVADAKGGIIVMFAALQRLAPLFDDLDWGWEVILNSDEEIGSPRSKETLLAHAKKHTFGCIFEPRLPDGSFVSSRAGSAVYQITSTGKASHAGRQFREGKNAIMPLVTFLENLHYETWLHPEDVFNVGLIQGGEAVNIVPDKAVTQLNIRSGSETRLKTYIQTLETTLNSIPQGQFNLEEKSYRPPKPLTPTLQRYFDEIQAICKDLNMPFSHRATNGVCDGNLLAQAGLPVIDTWGVLGDHIHTHNEYMLMDQLESCITLIETWTTHQLQKP